ncbi:unnamed protein product [Caenorhabditis sp. 36 PRJEB53466]|nr:unnamed protein product [Caenorhabditis sp. 36 PRJEB53466]
MRAGRSTRSSVEQSYIVDQYTNKLVKTHSKDTIKYRRIDSSPDREDVVESAASRMNKRKTTDAVPSLPAKKKDRIPVAATVPTARDPSPAAPLVYFPLLSRTDVSRNSPITAIEEIGEFATLLRQMKALDVFENQEDDDALLMEVLELAGQATIDGITSLPHFYTFEFVPAVQHLKLFKECREVMIDGIVTGYDRIIVDDGVQVDFPIPTTLADKNLEKFETFVMDGLRVDVPLPPKPVTFPAEMQKRANLNQEYERRLIEAWRPHYQGASERNDNY